jgi:uncharacterized integral membrane protein
MVFLVISDGFLVLRGFFNKEVFCFVVTDSYSNSFLKFICSQHGVQWD